MPTKTSLRRKLRFPANTTTKNDQVITPQLALENLPGYERGPLNARVWMDASGAMIVLPEGGGEIIIEQDDLPI